ncbi:TRAP transporter small permease [Virgibacillus sp. C22-A2]|uniref:TRAP transporter small permease n=1 Tax=Virgibacillus tibetensis TaxID=3042313 RepID=A0ABU6KJE7_9BACI|nr:TRAP transporter small permease [Virgibacillus sp. C22-A2]
MNKLIERVLSILTIISFTGVIGAVVVQIMSRYLPYSAVWTEEVTRYLFIYTICFGAPLGLLRGEYINVDVLITKFPAVLRKYYEIVIYVLILALNIVVIFQGYNFTLIGQSQKSATMGFPMSIIHFGFVIMGVFLSYYSLVQILRILKNQYNFDPGYEEE